MGADLLEDYELPGSIDAVDQLSDEEFDHLMVGMAVAQLRDKGVLSPLQQDFLDYLIDLRDRGKMTEAGEARYYVYGETETAFRVEMLGGTREEIVYEWRIDNPVKAAILDRSKRYTWPFYLQESDMPPREPTLSDDNPLNSSDWPTRVAHRMSIDDTL